MKWLTFAFVLCLALAGTVSAAVQNEPVASGFLRPVFVTAPPGDTGRLFVLEQHSGRIRIIDLPNRTVLGTNFLRVTGLTIGGEQGLLGMAFHPNYRENGYFYLNYTTSGPERTEIARFRVQGDPTTSNVADPTSKKVLLRYNQPYSNHNAGWLGFGPDDGYLYIASGDGGSGNDPQNHGQNRSSLLGKILRIDVDAGDPYAIPSGNPFATHPTYRKEIWAFGLRNPWRCSFDRVTGDLWIADVGQNDREEISLAPAGVGGLNFGWRPREGAIQNPAFPSEQPVTPATHPLHDYGRSFGYSVTGGYFYRGSQVPELSGKYIFADYGSSRFWTLTRNEQNVVVTEITSQISPSTRRIINPSSFGEDANGELYVCSLNGPIYKITSTTPPAQISNVRLEGDDLIFSFQAAVGQGYTVQTRSSWDAGSTWQDTTVIAPQGAPTTVTVTNAVTGQARYFRLRSP